MYSAHATFSTMIIEVKTNWINNILIYHLVTEVSGKYEGCLVYSYLSKKV